MQRFLERELGAIPEIDALRLATEPGRTDPRLDAFLERSWELLLAPVEQFHQHGQSGAWVSELMPHTAAIASDMTIDATSRLDVSGRGFSARNAPPGTNCGRPC